MYKMQLITATILVLLFVQSSLTFPVMSGSDSSTANLNKALSRHARSLVEGQIKPILIECKFIVLENLTAEFVAIPERITPIKNVKQK